MTGDLKARESKIPACHCSVLLEVRAVFGDQGLISVGLAVLKQPLLVFFLSPALTVPEL